MYTPLTRRVRVLIRVGDEFLAVKNWFGPGVWQLPGGGVKFGESIVQAGIREIEEELSVAIALDSVQVLSQDIVVTKQFGLLMRYQYIAVSLANKPDVETSKEVASYSWLSTKDSYNAAEINTALDFVAKQR